MVVLTMGALSDLVRVVWSSIAASLVVSVLFAGAVVGLIRAGELRRDGRDSVAAACTVAALLALVVCLAAVAYGIVLVGQKS